MIIKGKKGDAGLSTQQVLFYAAELAISAIIIILALQLMFSTVRGSEAQLVARDFVNTIQTMLSYPYAIYFLYPANLSTGSIDITKDNVRVYMNRGSFTAPLKLSRRMTIEETYFLNPKTLPIISFRDKIMFDNQEATELLCEKLYKLPRGQKFTIIYETNTIEEQKKANHLQTGLNILNPETNTKFKILEREDLNSQRIKISFGKEDTTTIVHDASKKEQEMFFCYARKKLSTPQKLGISPLTTEYTETETIQIILPSTDHLNQYLIKEEFKEHRQKNNIKTDIDLMQTYSIMIHEILKKIVE